MNDRLTLGALIAAACLPSACGPAVPAPGKASISSEAAYEGRWARTRIQCAQERQIWTIEPRRMGIYPELRYCLFETVRADQSSRLERAYSIGGTCLWRGRSSRDFIFFRVAADSRSMRVTFNDARGVRLVRCPDGEETAS